MTAARAVSVVRAPMDARRWWTKSLKKGSFFQHTAALYPCDEIERTRRPEHSLKT
jgi:hypothetical protein